MARTFHRKERLTALSEINVTPLIDLAFALLIIFMITAPLLEQSIDLQLPLESQKPQSTPEDIPFQVISINGEGQFYWDDIEVTEERLGELLAGLARQSNPPVISIRADHSLPYQKVITLVDMIKKNELTRINLETQVK